LVATIVPAKQLRARLVAIPIPLFDMLPAPWRTAASLTTVAVRKRCVTNNERVGRVKRDNDARFNMQSPAQIQP